MTDFLFFIIALIKKENTVRSPAYVYLLQTVLQTKNAHEGVTDFLFFIIAPIKRETTIKSPCLWLLVADSLADKERTRGSDSLLVVYYNTEINENNKVESTLNLILFLKFV